jgi:hypothetical protein
MVFGILGASPDPSITNRSLFAIWLGPAQKALGHATPRYCRDGSQWA